MPILFVHVCTSRVFCVCSSTKLTPSQPICGACTVGRHACCHCIVNQSNEGICMSTGSKLSTNNPWVAQGSAPSARIVHGIEVREANARFLIGSGNVIVPHKRCKFVESRGRECDWPINHATSLHCTHKTHYTSDGIGLECRPHFGHNRCLTLSLPSVQCFHGPTGYSSSLVQRGKHG